MSQRVTDVTRCCHPGGIAHQEISVALDPIEAVRLAGILASAECVYRLSKATGKCE